MTEVDLSKEFRIIFMDLISRHDVIDDLSAEILVLTEHDKPQDSNLQQQYSLLFFSDVHGAYYSHHQLVPTASIFSPNSVLRFEKGASGRLKKVQFLRTTSTKHYNEF